MHVRNLLSEIGIRNKDCHPNLPRGMEFRQLGLGGGSISFEEAIFLQGLIAITKPDNILELGTSNGASALFMGAAVKDMQDGDLLPKHTWVFTVDLATKVHDEALKIRDRLKLPVSFILNKNSLHYLDENKPDQNQRWLIFSDTDIPIRPLEIEKIMNTYPKGTVIAVHDTSDLHPFGPMKLREKIKSDNFLELPSPRGLTVLIV